MREFSKSQFSLRQAPGAVRAIYGAFLVLILPGWLTQLGFQIGRVGLSPGAIAAYYRGSESGDVMMFQKTFGQLLEVTHAHAFTMGVVFLILAHLFVSTRVPARWKVAVLAVTFAGTLGDLAGPWLVRYGAAWCAWILLVAWLAQSAGNLTLIAINGWECLALGARSENHMNDRSARR